MSPLNDAGAWVPWAVVEQLVALKLRPPSRWPVLLTVLLTSCRYGRRDARLSVAEIAERTGLSERTVKTALADLELAGLVQRTARYRRFTVPMLAPVVIEAEPIHPTEPKQLPPT
jgi:Winged helix-turn-helix DNA-binding